MLPDVQSNLFILFVLMTFNLKAFSAVAETLRKPYDAWIKPPLFLQFKKLAFGVAGY